MALTDLTRISTSGIATGSTIDAPILRKDVSFHGSQVGVVSALFDSSDDALEFGDNVKLRFGASNDLTLFHNSSDSVITHSAAGEGNLKILSGGAQSIECVKAGAVNITHNGSTKIETTTHGAVITGVLTATSFSGGISGDSIGNVYAASGISTFYDLRVSNNLTVQGTTTTLDTNLIGVDRVEVGADSDTIVGVAVTQSGAADIVNLFDGTTEVLTVKDGGSVGIGTINPTEILHIMRNDATGPTITLENNAKKAYINNWGSSGGGSGRTNRFEINATLQTQASYCAPYHTFMVGGAGDTYEKVRITSSGDLSLRTTTQNAYVGLTANSTAINTTLGSTAGASPRLYLKGTGNGQSDAGDVFIASGTGGIVNIRSAELMKFEVNSDNSTLEALRITSAGNVGITTSTVTTTQDRALTVYGTTGGELQLRAANFGGGGSGEGANLTFSYGSLFLTNNSTNGDIHFSTKKSGESTTEKMRVTESGLVGIGTVNPDRMLHIRGTGNALLKMEGDYSGSVTGIEGVLTASGANRYVTGVYGKVVNTSGSESNVASIRLWNQQASPTTSDSPGYITFNTTKDGENTATEKLRIGSDGKVGVGTNLSSSTYKFEVWDDTAATLMIRKGNASRIVFSNDSQTNTLYSQALPSYDARPFSVYIGSSEAIRIGVNGGVGIGTDYLSGNTSVYHKLMVEGDATSQIAVAKIVRRHSSASNGTYTLEVDSSSHTSNVANGGAMSVNVNSGRAFHIDGYGNIGINTSTALPTWCKLSINHGAFGLTQFSNHSHLVLQNKNAGNVHYWSLAPRDNGSISLARGPLDVNGTVADVHSTFSISSAGRVGIGSVANSSASFFEMSSTSGAEAYPFQTFNQSSYQYQPFNHEVTIRNNTVGQGDNFCGICFLPGAHSDGNRISAARISAIDAGDYRADLTFGTRGYRGGNIGFQEVLRLDSNGNASIADGNLSFASGHGIDFSETGNSSGTVLSNGEILNDYEEGTWVPTLLYGTGSGEASYSWRYGYYIKVGAKVTVWFNLGITGFNPSNTERVFIGNLPFQNNDPEGTWKYNNLMYGYSWASGWGFNSSSNKLQFLAMYSGESKIRIVKNDGAYIYTNDVGSGQRYSSTLSYFTDS